MNREWQKVVQVMLRPLKLPWRYPCEGCLSSGCALAVLTVLQWHNKRDLDRLCSGPTSGYSPASETVHWWTPHTQLGRCTQEWSVSLQCKLSMMNQNGPLCFYYNNYSYYYFILIKMPISCWQHISALNNFWLYNNNNKPPKSISVKVYWCKIYLWVQKSIKKIYLSM